MTKPAFNPLRPHNGLSPLPPPIDVETKTILKACVSARTAVAELRLAGQLIPDQTVLINTIPVLEAKDSSEIENIVTTNDALFREASLNDGESDPSTKEALRYRAALYRGLEAIGQQPISTNIAIEICRILKGTDLGIRRTSGTTLKNAATGEVIYTPPEGEAQLRDMLANWERFQNEPSDIDPLVKMAILHYQFEAIHPFIDGNGRTGRILNILGLVQDGVLDLPTLYLSRHILRTKQDYYRLLIGVTARGEWEPWILYILEAARMTSQWTTSKIHAVRKLMDATIDHVRAGAPKIYSRELIDVIFAQPYCRIPNLVERNIAKRQAASTYLKALVAIGVLQEEKAGRDKVFIHRKYLDLLASDGHTFAPYPAPVPAVAQKAKPR